MAVFAFGEAALPAATMVFLVANTLHFSYGIRRLNPHISAWAMFKVPVLWVSCVALAFNLLQIPMPKSVLLPIDLLGQISIPLMLFALGVRLAVSRIEHLRISIVAAIATPLTGVLMFF